MFKYKIAHGSDIGVVVDAVHLVEGNEDAILVFLTQTKCIFELPNLDELTMHIGNQNDSFIANKGEWLIKGSSGEFFALNDDEFENMYIALDQPYPQEGKMEFTTFVRRPFVVEAVQVTLENIAQVAEHVGTLKNEGENPYIQVDRRLVPNVFKVHPGFWMTRMGDNIRCYSDHIFKAQFIEQTEELASVVQQMSEVIEDSPETVEV